MVEEKENSSGYFMEIVSVVTETQPFYRTMDLKIYSLIICVVCAILFITGTFSNTMVIIIVRRLGQRRSSIDLLILSLAVSDIILVFETFSFPMLNSYSFGDANVKCKMVQFTMAVNEKYSLWVLTAIACHRAVAIVWPHRINVMVTRRTSFKLIAGLLLGSVGIYADILYGFGDSPVYLVIDNTTIKHTGAFCKAIEVTYEEYYIYFHGIVDNVAFTLIPFTMLALSSVIMMQKILAASKNVQRVLVVGQDTHFNIRHDQNRNSLRTVSALSVSAFIFFLPGVIGKFPLPSDLRDDYDMLLYLMVFNTFTTISYFRFQINFYILCLTGSKYRKEAKKILCWSCNLCDQRNNRKKTPPVRQNT